MMRTYLLTTMTFFLVLGSAAGQDAPKLAKLGPGQLRNLIVELPDDDPKSSRKLVSYRMHVVNIGSEKVDDRDCWKIQFFPTDNKTPEAQHRLVVSLDKETGWPRKVTAVLSKAEPRIASVGEARFVTDLPAGIPAEVLPSIPPAEFKEGNGVVRYQTTRVATETILDFTYTIDGKEKLRIRQRWTDGKDWWRYYDKHVDGKPVLRARAFDAAPLADPFTKIEPPPVVKFDFSLRTDKRLAVPVQIEPRGPSIGHVIERIREATKLDIALSPELETHKPSLGHFQGGPKGFLAWQLMEILRSRELENGRWEKTPTGYELRGVSKVVAKDDNPLRQDKRLFVMVRIDQTAPKVSDIFARVKDASGVELEVSAALRDHAPDLGHIGSGAVHNLMDLLAKKDIDNGRWEKTPRGYRLVGTSRAAAAPPVAGAPPAASDPPAADAAPGREFTYLWPCVGVVGVVVLLAIAGVGFVVVRRLAFQPPEEPTSVPKPKRPRKDAHKPDA